MLSTVVRRAWDGFLWWLDGLSALQALVVYLVTGLPTGILLATVGDTTASYIPFLVASGLFLLHCARRPRGGWDVFGCAMGPSGFVGILRAFGLNGPVSTVLGLCAVVLSFLLAWSYDRLEAETGRGSDNLPDRDLPG